MPAYHGADFLDAAIAKDDLTAVLVIKSGQGCSLHPNHCFFFTPGFFGKPRSAPSRRHARRDQRFRI
jgi:hypothetical protein